MERVSPIVVVMVALLSAGAATICPNRAAARAKPCWEQVIDDWLDNETIDNTYTASCYQQALKHVPEDLREYSAITDAIAIALQRSLSDGSGLSGGDSRSVGAANDGGSSGGRANTSGASQGGAAHNRSYYRRSYYRRALDHLGSTSASSIPIPLLVLAGLGVALVVAAASLVAHRRLVARRDRTDA